MKEFDAHAVLLQCCPHPLADEHKKMFDGKICYRMITPYMYCSWGRGFYFQPVILEFSFEQLIPNHSSKTTFINIRWKEGEFKTITQLDGTVTQYPILTFYICINRDLFRPLAAHHNKIEWLNSITPRTEGIAHELIYANQYAKRFDPAVGLSGLNITIPTVDEEEELLCPTYQIETYLGHEEEIKVSSKNQEEFLKQQGTQAVQKYYRMWLENQGVKRDICHRKTCAYFEFRSQRRELVQTA